MLCCGMSEALMRVRILSNLSDERRVVELVPPSEAPSHPRVASRFEEQRWSHIQRCWQPTGVEWNNSEWSEEDFWRVLPVVRRGPLPSFVPEESQFLFIGTVELNASYAMGNVGDEGPTTWPVGRFNLQHQCLGIGMAQALLDGAFFVIEENGTPLAAGLGNVLERANHDSRDCGPYPATDDNHAAQAGVLLGATPFPTGDHRELCGEALHLFHLSDAVLQRIVSTFNMVTALVNPGWPFVEKTEVAPFSSVAEFARWRGAPVDQLVVALVYENCD
jgi:hypothetical protein